MKRDFQPLSCRQNIYPPKRKGNQKSNKNNNKFTLKCLSIHFLLNQYWDDKPRIVTASCYWFITIQKHMTTVILLQHFMGITNNV